MLREPEPSICFGAPCNLVATALSSFVVSTCLAEQKRRRPRPPEGRPPPPPRDPSCRGLSLRSHSFFPENHVDYLILHGAQIGGGRLGRAPLQHFTNWLRKCLEIEAYHILLLV